MTIYGKLIGASLGPGDPMLITRRSWDVLQSGARWLYPVKKAEETMARLTADLARLDDDLATAAVNDPKALEGLTRARAKAQADLDAAEAAWIAAEEALAEVA